MTGQEFGRGPSEQFLVTLRGELASRGVDSDLRDEGGQPRLDVYARGRGAAGDEPLDSVAVARLEDGWWYCWAALMPICGVTPVTGAAQAVISELGLDRDCGGDSGADVPDLGVWRKLRQARQDFCRPSTSGPAAAGPAARVWDAYDAAVKEAQADVMESTGLVLSGLLELTALLPVSAGDLAGMALRLDGLAADLAGAAQALRAVTG
jgi:hypothetical protein